MDKNPLQRFLELFNNQKIGVKILIGYMIAFMLAAAVGILAVYQFGQVSATIYRLTGPLAQERDLAEKTAIQIHLVRLRAGQYIYQGQNPNDLKAYNRALGDAQSLMNEVEQVNMQTDRAETQAQIRKDFNNFAAAFAEIVQLLAVRQATIDDVLTPQGALSAEKLALLRNNNYEILDFTTAYYASQARETFSQMQVNVIQFLATGNEQYASQADADYAVIRSTFDLLQDSARDNPSRLLLNEIETATAAYYRGFQNAQTDIALQHALTTQLDILGPAIVNKTTAIADDINAEFTAQSQQVNTRVKQLQSWTVLAIFLAVIVGLIFDLMLSRAITRPIEQMARAAQGVAAGAFEQQVEIPGKDELGILAGAFNDMTTRVRETMATLMEEIAERKRRITELSILNEISRSLSLSLILDEVLETVHQQVSRIFDTTSFYIATYEEGSDEWTLIFDIGYGQRQPVIRRKLEVGLAGHIIRSRAPVLLRSRTELLAFEQEHRVEAVGELDASWMGVPLVAAGEVVGVMAIQSYERENLYDEQALALFSTIGSQVAVAIRNARLYEAVQRQLAERKRADEAMMESEKRFYSIAETASEGIIIFDRQENISYWNAAAKAIFGYGGGETLGKLLDTVVLGEFAEVFRQIMQEVISTGRSERLGKSIEATGVRKDGSKFPMELSIAAWKIKEAVFFTTITRDITERKRAEENIHKLNNELEAFSYSVSHDLRAPLRAMEGFSAALLSNYRVNLDEQGQHYLDRIQQASQRMAQLISDLLNLSRITRTELNSQSVDLGSLAREIAAELQMLDPQRQAEFVIAEPLTVQGDSNLLRIALQNLLANAWKFSGTRQKAVIEVGQMNVADFKLHNENWDSSLSQSEISNPRSIIYYVRDNGVGFGMEHAAKLFAPFQRLHAMNEFPGTGIGLAIVQRVIARHGGRIWVHAQVDQGATFYFTLGEERR